jgi:hypothetical protein
MRNWDRPERRQIFAGIRLARDGRGVAATAADHPPTDPRTRGEGSAP